MFYLFIILQDTAAVVKKFMERDPEEVRFTVVALAKRSDGAGHLMVNKTC